MPNVKVRFVIQSSSNGTQSERGFIGVLKDISTRDFSKEGK
jgi:hypothetical protein